MQYVFYRRMLLFLLEIGFETSLVSVYDVNQDNNIDSKDAVVVLKYYAEMIVGNLNMSLSEYVSKR